MVNEGAAGQTEASQERMRKITHPCERIVQ